MIVAMPTTLVVVWTAYAVAHVGKAASSDLVLFLLTVPPYFLVCLVLWWLGGRMLRRLRRDGARPGAAPLGSAADGA